MKAPVVIERLAGTVAEGGEMLGMSNAAAYRSVRMGTWPCPAALFKVGSQTKVSFPILRRWLNGEIAGDGTPVAASAPSTATGSPAPSGQPAALPTQRRREGQASSDGGGRNVGKGTPPTEPPFMERQP